MKLLDLCCCEGGASVGYSRAGFEVTGVDLFKDYTQARYPFRSVRADAIEFVELFGHEFDVIHASPPCQAYSRATSAIDRAGYPDLIERMQVALRATGKPYVIENVRDAKDRLWEPLKLCGCMFDLHAIDHDGILLHMTRERYFESNIVLESPKPCDHTGFEWIGGSYGGARRDKYDAKFVRKGGYVPPADVQQELLRIDWMTQRGMWQSIPPVYTEWLGGQLMEHCLSENVIVSHS